MPERVLLADPSQTVRALARLSLAGEAHELITVADSGEAQEALRRERPSVVIADAMLKPLDGYELCRALRAQSPGLRFVLMSPEYLPVDEALAGEVGVAASLRKPFDRQSLLAVIEGKSLVAAPVERAPSPVAHRGEPPAAPELRASVERAVAERLPALLEDLVPRIAEELRETVRGAVLEALPATLAGLLPELLPHLRAVVEPIAWKSVPAIAEEIVKEEIARLTGALD